MGSLYSQDQNIKSSAIFQTKPTVIPHQSIQVYVTSSCSTHPQISGFANLPASHSTSTFKILTSLVWSQSCFSYPSRSLDTKVPGIVPFHRASRTSFFVEDEALQLVDDCKCFWGSIGVKHKKLSIDDKRLTIAVVTLLLIIFKGKNPRVHYKNNNATDKEMQLFLWHAK